jgi:putative membrane protein
MYWYGGHHLGVWGWLVMWLLTVIFWGGLLTVGFVLVRSAVTRHSPDDARRLLDERLARGEIDADDYARRRDLLERR